MQKRREKGEDLRLLYFSVASLLFTLTFTSCLSSLYHPNVLRSSQSALPLSVLPSGFAAEATAQHQTRDKRKPLLRNQWASSQGFGLVFFFFPVLLWLSNAVSLYTRRMYTRWEKLIDPSRPALINPEENLIDQSITTVNSQVQLVAAAASGFFHKHGSKSPLNQPLLFSFMVECIHLLLISAAWWVGKLCLSCMFPVSSHPSHNPWHLL